jgi:hypothetical protein
MGASRSETHIAQALKHEQLLIRPMPESENRSPLRLGERAFSPVSSRRAQPEVPWAPALNLISI